MKRLLVGGIPLATLVGVLACFGDDAVGASINSALASIAAAFPDVPYSQVVWLYTLPKVVIVPMTLASGLLVGRKVSFRLAAIVGFTLIAVAGVAPFFLSDFWAILATRFIMGIGLGIQAPIGPALVMQLFDRQDQRAFVLGLGHGFINVYGVITNLLVGVLCVIEWRYAFLAYGTVFVLLLCAVLFLRNPTAPQRSGMSSETSRQAACATHLQREKLRGGGCSKQNGGSRSGFAVLRSLSPRVYALCAVYLVTLCLWGVAGLNLSAIISDAGFGDAATAGVVLSLINLSGMVAGFSFGLINRVFKRYTLAFGYLVMTCGLTLYFFAADIVMLSVGVFVAGLANTILITGFENEVGLCCDASQVSVAMSLCMVVSQLSGFLTGFYISLVMDVAGLSFYAAPLGVSAVLMAVLCAGFALRAKLHL